MLAINPKIKQKAEDIRKKIFGSEVRESLASGIEAISEDVEETIGRQDYVEEQFQNVIDETTDKDVISAPELIAARNGKSNLKTRLDDEHAQVTAQLQQKANESKANLLTSQVITLQDYINNNLLTIKYPTTSDITNFGATASIDVDKNLLISKSGSDAFTWVTISKDTLNSEFEFTMSSNNVYLVLCANTDKCVAIQMGVNVNDFGLVTRWKSNGTSENINTPHSNQSLKAINGDIIKVKRLSGRWKFYKNGIEWIEVTYILGQANFISEFSESEFRYGVMKYSATTNEIVSKNWGYKEYIVLPVATQNYAGKKWNAIGDSITWLDKYEPLVKNALGLHSYRNYGKSGYSTVMLKGDVPTWDNDADLITFFAGTNDFGRCDTLETTETSVDYIFSNLKTKYPNKIIAVFLPLQRWGYTGDTVKGPQATMTNSDGITLRQYCDVIYNKAREYGFPVLDLYYESGITKDNISTYTNDGLHPNDEGFSKIAEVMIDFLNSINHN